MPRARPPAACTASTIALLSAPWQVACTITLRLMPRWSRSANSWSLPASHGRVLAFRRERELVAGAEDVAVGVDGPGRQGEAWGGGFSYQSSQPGVLANSAVMALLVELGWASVDDSGLRPRAGISSRRRGRARRRRSACACSLVDLASAGLLGDIARACGRTTTTPDVSEPRSALIVPLGVDRPADDREVHRLQCSDVAVPSVDDLPDSAGRAPTWRPARRRGRPRSRGDTPAAPTTSPGSSCSVAMRSIQLSPGAAPR